MSRPDDVGDGPATGAPKDEPPRVRLQTWVNVVLILILFASCGTDTDSLVRQDTDDRDLREVCRMLVAIAEAEGVELEDEVFRGDFSGPCGQAWQQRSG